MLPTAPLELTNTIGSLPAYGLLPALPVVSRPIICHHCRFVNSSENNFCTNCGHPVIETNEVMTIYNMRLHKRRRLRLKCMEKIAYARTVLYILAAIFMFGIFYLFSDWRASVVKGVVMLFLAALYAGLGRWSLQKPFTSLLISLIVLITFTAINTWAEITSAHPGSGGFYMLVIQVVLIYVMLNGVQAAFHADILEEEKQ